MKMTKHGSLLIFVLPVTCYLILQCSHIIQIHHAHIMYISDSLQILCFTAASTVSLLIGIVSLQLLRLGLVDHTTSGQTFIKEEKDSYVMVALVTMSIACGFAVISLCVSCFIARHMKRKQRYLDKKTISKEQMIAERQEQLRKV